MSQKYEPKMVPVSEAAPLHRCRHFVSAATQIAPSAGSRSSGSEGDIAALYSGIGVTVLGTVLDGDCGIDVLCQMRGLP